MKKHVNYITCHFHRVECICLLATKTWLRSVLVARLSSMRDDVVIKVTKASFMTAVALAFTSLLISPDYDIAANVMFTYAQFLTLCATILGIVYKYASTYGKKDTSRNTEQ